MKYYTTILSFLLLSQLISSQTHWESIVIASNTWSYLPAVSAPPVNWFQPSFNDSAWKKGAGGFGFGDGDDATVTSAVNSIYLRKKITIADTSIIKQLLLDIDYDDAFVFYLNGIEVARSSNITAHPPLYNSPLTTDHEAQLYQNVSPERYVLSPAILKKGENTLAFQILNVGLSSTDMSALVFLNAEINSTARVYYSVPSWFMPPLSSTLPIILINTQGQTIVNEPKINAWMKVINNPDRENSFNDSIFEYDGNIAIEIRGTTSQMFSKKCYNVETRTDSGTNLNVSLLGLPKENDWVLNGPYSDKTLIRNVLAYCLGNLTGRWSPRTKFCELLINGEYRGVYVLIEKIKCDKHRVNIATLKPDEISGDDLTGGYLLKIDRPDPGAWISPYKVPGSKQQSVPISYVDPEYADLAVEQRAYIKNYVNNFENALYGTNFKDSVKGYRPYVNIISFVDYYIINEISRNLDAYRVSTYFHKDKDSKGGKLTMGPFWDYDLAFGNGDFFSANLTEGWVAAGLGDGDAYGIPFWWAKLRQDPFFEAHLKMRWDELRAVKFSNENIEKFIDTCTNALTYPQVRNFQKFNILNSYVWPNAYWGGTYADQVNYLKNWINARLKWMDTQMKLITATIEPPAPPVDPPTDPDTLHTKVSSLITLGSKILTYPNPFRESVTICFNLARCANVNISIQNTLGQIIHRYSQTYDAGLNEVNFEGAIFKNASDIYFYDLIIDGVLIKKGKIVKE